MPIENRLILSGTVCSVVKQSQSPLGIPSYKFWIEHRSTQIEVNLERQAWCKIPVQISGNQLVEKTQGITVGSKILIQGFLTTHQLNNGLTQLVLHAEQIEFID